MKYGISLLALLTLFCSSQLFAQPEELDAFEVALYAQCKNTLAMSHIISDKITDNQYLNIKCENAKTWIEEKTGHIVVIPNENIKEVEVEVYSEKEILGSKVFKVEIPPQAKPTLSYGGNPVDLRKGISLTGYSQGKFSISVNPDTEFKMTMPLDARYVLGTSKVTLAREKRAIATMTFNGGGEQAGNIQPILAKAEAGDRLVVEIGEVTRVNANSEAVKDSSAGIVFVIPLTVD